MGGGGAEWEQHVGGGGVAMTRTLVTFSPANSAQLSRALLFLFRRRAVAAARVPGEPVSSEEVPA